MRSYIRLRFLFAILAASTLIMTTQSLVAQGAGRGQGGGRGAFQNMSEESRAAMQQMNQETRELATQVTEARTALNDAIFASTMNANDIRAKAAALADAEAKLALGRAAAFQKVKSKFTPEEVALLKRMGGGGRGFGGGGQGRGVRRGGADGGNN